MGLSVLIGWMLATVLLVGVIVIILALIKNTKKVAIRKTKKAVKKKRRTIRKKYKQKRSK